MTSHTPGPWSFDGPPHNIIVWSSPQNRICFMTSDGPAEANARLIAAAPDMLAALKEIEALWPLDLLTPQNQHLPYFATARMIRDAISKAEGREG